MYLFFDTETTGVPPGDDRVHMVQLAWILQSEAHHIVAHGNFIVKPDGWTVPDEVAKIHGISTARANTEGIPVGEILSIFAATLYIPCCLVAHNINFDLGIVTTEYKRLGWDNPLYGREALCTMQASTDLCAIPRRGGGFKWPKLMELHTKLFGDGFANAHDALVDVKALLKCFWELRRMGRI